MPLCFQPIVVNLTKGHGLGVIDPLAASLELLLAIRFKIDVGPARCTPTWEQDPGPDPVAALASEVLCILLESWQDSI